MFFCLRCKSCETTKGLPSYFKGLMLTVAEGCDPRLAETAGLEERQKSSLKLVAERNLAVVLKEQRSNLFSYLSQTNGELVLKPLHVSHLDTNMYWEFKGPVASLRGL